MTANILRKELQGYIAAMPERNLAVLKPLLSVLAEDHWKPIIEPASQEEIAMCDKRMKDYDTDPSSFALLR